MIVRPDGLLLELPLSLVKRRACCCSRLSCAPFLSSGTNEPASSPNCRHLTRRSCAAEIRAQERRRRLLLFSKLHLAKLFRVFAQNFSLEPLRIFRSLSKCDSKFSPRCQSAAREAAWWRGLFLSFSEEMKRALHCALRGQAEKSAGRGAPKKRGAMALEPPPPPANGG